MQVAADGAGVLVAEMARSGWESVRDAMVRFFRRGGEDPAEQELRLLDTARLRLTESAEGERESVAETLQRELLIQLAAFLQKHPETAAELQALVDQAQLADEGSGARLSAHHNTNSQVIVSGGSISAGGSFSYRAPEGEK